MGGITPAELAAIGDRLEGFAADVFESLPRRDQRGRGECYLRGLLLDGRRKSIQPMAARLGEVHYQALHHFVASSPWDPGPVRRRLAEVLTAALSPTAWVVDDTGFPKDGPCSVGVQRQYCGTLGKRANCQLGVSVNAITEHASCPLDWRLFVPESWDEEVMAARRAACHLPDEVRHRPKWQLLLDMLDELAGWGLVPPVLGAARSTTWWRSAPTPRPTPSRRARRPRRPRAGAAVPGRATTTSRPRWPSWPWRPDSRPGSSLSGGVGAGACNAAGSWRCGCVRPGLPRAGWHGRPAASCRCAGCWPSGPRASPNRPSTGWPTCPRPPRSWSWSGWPGRGGEWSRMTANAKARSGWTTSRGAPGLAGTTT